MKLETELVGMSPPSPRYTSADVSEYATSTILPPHSTRRSEHTWPLYHVKPFECCATGTAATRTVRVVWETYANQNHLKEFSGDEEYCIASDEKYCSIYR